MRPDVKLGVVLGVRVGGRDHRDALRGRVAIQPRDRGHDPLGAGDIERARRVQEVELRIDIEKGGAHRIRLRRVRSISSRSSRL